MPAVTEYPRMRATQARHHNAIIDVHRVNAAVTGTGDPAPTYTTTYGVSVGFAFDAGSRTDPPDYVEVKWDAILRTPGTLSFELGDEVSLRSLAGQTYNIRFRVLRKTELGPTANNTLLERIEH